MPQVALLQSAETYWDEADGAAFGRGGCRELTKGALDALLELHYSVDILSEHQILPRLHEFPVVVIPDAYKLTDEFRQSLLDYVDRRGQSGTARRKVCEAVRSGTWCAVCRRAQSRCRIDRRRWTSVSWTDGWQQIAVAGAKVISERSVERGGQSESEPAATVVTQGKGRIAAIYGPVAVEVLARTSRRHPRTRGNRHARSVSAADHHRGRTRHVDLAVRRTRDGLLSVHFLNLARVQRGETEFPPMDPYPADRIVYGASPLPDKPTAVRWEPEGQAIEWSWHDGVLTAVVPGVHIHGVLLVE